MSAGDFLKGSDATDETIGVTAKSRQEMSVAVAKIVPSDNTVW